MQYIEKQFSIYQNWLIGQELISALLAKKSPDTQFARCYAKFLHIKPKIHKTYICMYKQDFSIEIFYLQLSCHF